MSIQPPSPDFRRIPCPACKKGVIRMAAGSGRFECSRLFWEHSGFKGGHCDFATRDRSAIPLEPGDSFTVLDFTPFAFRPTA